MSPTQKKRLTIAATILTGVGLASFLGLQAFRANIEYFLTPQQINDGHYQDGRTYRVAGLVRTGTVHTIEDGVTHRFDVTDCVNHVSIQYTGILPDLFREGQAIVARGRLDGERVLIASKVLAKHDENYVPNEAADAMMRAQANKCNDADGVVEF